MQFFPPTNRLNSLGTSDREREAEILWQLADECFDLIACATIDGRGVFLNRAGREVLGIEAEQVPQTTIADYHSAGDMTYFHTEILPVLLRDGCWTGEFRFQHFQTGDIIPVDFHAFTIKDPLTDEVTHLATISRDLRDRLKIEADRESIAATLRESERKFQVGTWVAGVALARFDYANNTVELSPEAADLYGIPRDELKITRDRIHATFHPDDRDWLEETIARVVDPNGVGWFADDHRVVWPNGEVRWLSVRKQVFFNRDREVPRADYAILAALDISERKQLEAMIQSQLAQIEAIYASAPIGLCFLDRQRRFVHLNERLAEINGLPISAHLGRTVREILPELAEIQEPIFDRVLTTGEAVLDLEVSGQTPAQPGIERTWLVSYHPLPSANTEQIGINIMVQEITERKQAEAERERLLAAAEAANRSKDEFVAIVAHELRSPLNSIAGWARLLQGRDLEPSVVNRALETIVRNTQVQVQLIEDLLDISRLIRGTLHLQIECVDLAATIAAAIDLVLPQAQTKQIHLEARIDRHPQVDGDRHRLQQIVVNLLTNAIKFTPAGGRVTIELSEIADRACVRISDTGKGIAPEFLSRIFDRFEQEQLNTGAKDGLGLGLAIVKNLVELHYGSIEATSPGIGRGATFTLYLPRTADRCDLPSAIATEVGAGALLAGVRILVVDDEPDMTELVEFILSDAGAEVLSANSVAAACECWERFQPQVLISDLAMPEATGYDLLNRARSLPTGNIPAIALTAYASLDAEEQSRQAGFQLYLTKPASPEALIAAIASLLGIRD